MSKCPYCQSELSLPEDGEWTTCESCQHRLNIAAQQAYARAKAAFLSVQDYMMTSTIGMTSPTIYRAKAKLDLPSLAPEVIRAYQQAYSGLNIAFQYDLPESQKLSGIEMMTEITKIFAPRAIVSDIEAEYWTKLMITITSRNELQRIEERLTQPSYSPPLAFLTRWRLKLRRYQLTQALNKLATKISDLEQTIGFLNPPRVH